MGLILWALIPAEVQDGQGAKRLNPTIPYRKFIVAESFLPVRKAGKANGRSMVAHEAAAARA
jgi:hypothetical protein